MLMLTPQFSQKKARHAACPIGRSAFTTTRTIVSSAPSATHQRAPMLPQTCTRALAPPLPSTAARASTVTRSRPPALPSSSSSSASKASGLWWSPPHRRRCRCPPAAGLFGGLFGGGSQSQQSGLEEEEGLVTDEGGEMVALDASSSTSLDGSQEEPFGPLVRDLSGLRFWSWVPAQHDACLSPGRQCPTCTFTSVLSMPPWRRRCWRWASHSRNSSGCGAWCTRTWRGAWSRFV